MNTNKNTGKTPTTEELTIVLKTMLFPIVLIGVLVVSLICDFFVAKVVVDIWYWYIASTFPTVVLTFKAAVGIVFTLDLILYGLYIAANQVYSNMKIEHKYLKFYFLKFAVPALTWLIAYIVQNFI